MDHITVLKRAWRITWSYRALWFFGFLLALTTAGGGGGSGARASSDQQGWENMFPHGEFQWPSIQASAVDMFNQYLPLIILLALLGLALAVAGAILRYVSETSLIRMVNEEEESGSKASIKEGFRKGWSRQAFHLFLIDLLAGLGGFLLLLVPALIVGAPLLVWLTDSTALQVMGTVIAASLGLLLLFAVILVFIGIALVLEFARRACIIEKKGPVDSIKYGISMLRNHLGESVLMGLILVGIGILFAVAMIPLLILLVLAGAVIGGIPGLLVFGLTSIFAQGELPVILATIVGLPIFIAIVAIPSAFILGIMETFKSSTWTLTFREFQVLDGQRPASILPKPSLSPQPVERIEPEAEPAFPVGEDRPEPPQTFPVVEDQPAPAAAPQVTPPAQSPIPGSMAGKKVAAALDEDLPAERSAPDENPPA